MEKWKVNLYILWFTQVISLTSFGLGLPFLSLYIQELGVTEPESIKVYTGVLSSATAVTMAFMAPVWGRLSDRYGRKLMILRAMFAATFVIGCMGMVNHVWQLVALRAAQGLFTGTITAATTFVAANTPSNKLSSSLGFMSSSSFIGFAIGPMIGGYFAEFFGYRFSFIAGGILMFLGFLLVLFLVKEDKSTYGQTSSKSTGKNGGVFTAFIVSLLFVLFFHRLTRSLFSPFLALFVQETLDSTAGVASITGMIGGLVAFFTAISAIVVGRLADKYDKNKLLMILLGLGLVVGIGINLVSSLNSFVVIYVLLFFVLGGIEPVITSTTAENTDPDKRGMLFGYQGMVGSFAWMVSPLIGTVISVSMGIKAILILIPFVILVNMFIISRLSFIKPEPELNKSLK